MKLVFFIKVGFALYYSQVLQILKWEPTEYLKMQRVIFELFFHYAKLGPGVMAMYLVS